MQSAHVLEPASADVLDAVLQSSAIAMFEAYGVAASEATPASGTRLREFAAIIGFSGAQLRGSLVVTLDRALVEVSGGGQVEGNAQLDWVGEVANQVLGRLKNRLLQFGVNIDLSTPVAISGDDLASTVRHSTVVRIVNLETIHGFCSLFLDYRLIAPVDLTDEAKLEVSVQSEGELLLF